ncbi:MAG: hypothetical protein K8R53_06665 [Bacteroidales bacterium]|nr:hypothetical protein [Bacteroidales bacterium]
MKRIVFLIVLMNLIIFCNKINGQVGINPNGSDPDISAGLDVDFDDKGFLPPRMNTLHRDAIVSPAAGLIVYNTDENCLQFFNGTTWSGCLGESVSNELLCNTSAVEGQYMEGVALTANEYITIDIAVNVIGSYSISTEIINGYSFSVNGVFSATGIHSITLPGAGTPVAGQTDDFIISINNSAGTCDISITVAEILPSCLAWLNAGYNTDGIYTIDPDGAGGLAPFDCYCDMTTDGGGWTRISYTNDLPHANHFGPPDEWRWLPSDFDLTLTDEQINAIRNISTSGKQDVSVSCQGVIVYEHISVGYVMAFGYRYHTGFETAYGQQTYPNTNLTINTDGCKANDNVVRQTTMTIYDTRLPVVNLLSKDSGDSFEFFGSPLTNTPAWLR